MRRLGALGGWLMAVGYLAWDVTGYATGAPFRVGVTLLIQVATLAGLGLAATGLARLPAPEARSGLGMGASLAGAAQLGGTLRSWGAPGTTADTLPALGVLLVAWAALFVADRVAFRIAAGGFALVALGVSLWIPVNLADGTWYWQPGTLAILAGALVAAWQVERGARTGGKDMHGPAPTS